MKKGIQTIYVEVNKCFKEFENVIRAGEKQHLEEINRVTNRFVKFTSTSENSLKGNKVTSENSLSETHLKKEEVLGVQPILQDQLEEKHNTQMFEPLVDKDSILKMSRRQILDESENPCRLPHFIKLSYPQKLKRKDVTPKTLKLINCTNNTNHTKDLDATSSISPKHA